MFYLDDLVMSPFKGFLFIAKEVAKAVEQEKENVRANNMTELSALHARLEAGEITEDEFDEREAELLDLLDSQE
ncbi:MAG: gas vesicle protein GvpG [Planctomycetota bacterium]|nr:gas vesicle protein GvpG [Planctomycetota bacterium]